MSRLVIAAAALLLVAAGPKDFASVTDSSFVAADGTRTLRLSALIPAPPAEVWTALSTPDGWARWGTKTAYLDFRQGGQIETSYAANAPRGHRDNIRNQIIDIVPERLLVIRNVQAPRDFFGDAALFGRIVGTIRLEPEAGGTRLTLSQEGYGATPAFDNLYSHFAWGNAYTLDGLRKSFIKEGR